MTTNRIVVRAHSKKQTPNHKPSGSFRSLPPPFSIFSLRRKNRSQQQLAGVLEVNLEIDGV